MCPTICRAIARKLDFKQSGLSPIDPLEQDKAIVVAPYVMCLRAWSPLLQRESHIECQCLKHICCKANALSCELETARTWIHCGE